MRKPHTSFKNIFTLVLFFATFCSYSQDNTAIAVCCSSAEARCTGSSSCRACTNCSRCGYCNSGGSCGVCSRGSNRATSPTSSKSNSNNSIRNGISTVNAYYLNNDTQSEYYLKTLVISIDLLNLRNGPGVNYSILAKLKRDQQLTFLANKGEWVKVRVKENELEGFVHSQYITITN